MRKCYAGVVSLWKIISVTVSDLALRRQLEEQGLLSQFSEDAIKWAEQGVEWIEIEGESFTLISQLQKLKGVKSSDFQKQAGLSEASSFFMRKLPEAHERLLLIPGVRRASMPTSFEVDGALVLHCGGPDAKSGITFIVRKQRPDWVRSQYLLANMPAALAYLSHGSSSIAKATRDLTIGTTMNVAKVAAKQETAPMAVQQIAGIKNPELAAGFQLLYGLIQEQQRTEEKADRSLERSEQAHQRIDRLELKSIQPAAKSKRTSPIKATTELLQEVWRKNYSGLCPCCKELIRAKDLEVDHWLSKSSSEPTDVWVVCGPCNVAMGAPVGDGGKKRTAEHERSFRTFQDLLRMKTKTALGIQLRLGLDAA
jgi:hypothetical protein